MIKKIGIALLCATTLSSALMGNEETSDSKMIIGLEIGASQIQANNIYSPVIGELDYKGNDVEYGFRIGAENEEWKTLIVADYYDNKDDDQKYTKGLLEVDYFILPKSTVKPYIGLNVGYMNYQTTDIDENGLFYGGQVGLQYNAMENLSFDLSYRYSYVAADNVDFIAGAVFGINYIF